MDIQFSRTNGPIDTLIDDLMAQSKVHHPYIIREMILSALKAGQDSDYLADLKLMRTTLKEMRYTTKIFSPYRERRKVTIFGSARTLPEEPIYQKCAAFARLLADNNYMVITGGGGGIMEAGNAGAGAENSFAVNIKLPFEQDTNPVMENSDRTLTYKYFFNRKVAFLKEAQAVALFPGGFGTLDEAMETLTLVQTGKNQPIPLVLIEDDNSNYWEDLFQFMRKVLLPRNLISGEDFGLFTITKNVQEAFDVIDSFYRVYHSSRYIGQTLVIRLNKELTTGQIATLEQEFSDLLRDGGRVRASRAFEKEKDEPDLWQLPRLAVDFNRRSYGYLIAFIRRINSF
ncbi:LOG family protein [Desulfuromonas thiophila]|uniref:LOG family protein n=1 Tax=Desulfuromonas thiophila TaxID=57664 RepID=UPI0024A94159|nr:LOG family protein [Desulfuromonas thiophila]